jgi:hypothetical protein
MQVPLKSGGFAVVDDADAALVAGYEWRSMSITNSDLKYAAAYRAGEHFLMHRLIASPPAGMVVDHLDADGLNNRRANLRVCAQSLNIQRSRPRRDGVSCFKGVHRNRGRWRAMIRAGGKSSHVGYFDTERDAAMAYDRAAVATHGEFAMTNAGLGLFDPKKLPKR